MSAHVAVVGGSLAGLRAAEQLRSAGHEGPITVFSEEAHLPYNRPPLSKELLADEGEPTADDLHARVAFRRRKSTEDVDFQLGVGVEQADLAAGTLQTYDGQTHEFDGLVVATGLRPRRLRVTGPEEGRHVLRTLEDLIRLRGQVRPGQDVVVVGAGFIGCETAATLLKKGCSVTLVEPTGAPMNRVLGVELADAVQRHHEAAGMRFVIDDGVHGYGGGDAVAEVQLASGGSLTVDLVIESVGSVPNVEWLEGNTSLDLSDGVLTDNSMGVVGADRAVAVGDIARFPNPLFDDVPRRVEHWSIPTDTAKRAAQSLQAMLSGGQAPDAPFAPIPSFWSDQLDLRFQSFGSPSLADEIRIDEGNLDALTDGVLATYLRDGRLVGSVAVNLDPARQRRLRDDIAALAP
ncbi:MAG: NAD(P)/FAD-dependent oxidoreductase [Micrococcales bacterium]|nr:NAD(P)/FAD-dependent oxidoreductase [Micrococcales bacterium]